MSDMLNEAVAKLNEKMGDGGFNGTAKFDVTGEGAIMLDSDGARVADEDADVTLTASADVFRNIIEGEQNPTTAFMTGKLSIDGDMGKAMALASVLG